MTTGKAGSLLGEGLRALPNRPLSQLTLTALPKGEPWFTLGNIIGTVRHTSSVTFGDSFLSRGSLWFVLI